MNNHKLLLYIGLLDFGFSGCNINDQFKTWECYRGDPGANCYSLLDQINRNNVSDLQPAWVFKTGDAREGNRSTIECNPIVIDDIIYFTSPQLKLYALNAATGKEVWMFNPFREGEARDVNRGVAYWREGSDKRILFPAYNRLFAINAETGKPVPAFGINGSVDLREGLDRKPEEINVAATTPGVVYKDLYITGLATDEGDGAAPGYIRAYNVRTGKLEWVFHTIPHPGEYGYDTWKNKDGWKIFGGANNWAGLALDRERGIVYCPTGSVAPDFYGGNRKGRCLFADCLIALNAGTGKRLWHFQAVHHNIWDYDLPSTPNLITIKKGGKIIDVVAQITKMGNIFVFDRETGEPVFPIEERPVSQSDVDGEETSPTQPFPVEPPPFVRQKYADEDLPTISEESRQFAVEKLKTVRNEGIFTPLSNQGTLVFPGFRGGGEWSGASFDFESGILYVNANQIPNLVSIKKTGGINSLQKSERDPGAELYSLKCALCHGADRKGQEVFPSLIDVGRRFTADKMDEMIRHGKGVMPAFPQLTSYERKAIIAYVLNTDRTKIKGGAEGISVTGSPNETKFITSGYAQFLDEQGYPAVKPPWGTLSAIDMNRGEILWQKPLGEFPELSARGIPPTGTQNFGGSLVTAGGLVFIGASADEKIRAFDKRTGEILWEYKLPYGGYATPSTYEIDHQQYVVIAAGGGGKVGTKSGDAYIAFKLKKQK